MVFLELLPSANMAGFPRAAHIYILNCYGMKYFEMAMSLSRTGVDIMAYMHMDVDVSTYTCNAHIHTCTPTRIHTCTRMHTHIWQAHIHILYDSHSLSA